MKKLDFAISTIRRMKDLNGIPFNRMLICLALARGPLQNRDLNMMVNRGKYEVGGALTTAMKDGYVRVEKAENGHNLYHLTEVGVQLVQEILNPPPAGWPEWMEEVEA